MGCQAEVRLTFALLVHTGYNPNQEYPPKSEDTGRKR
jgi:hypothetical protein